MKNWSTKNEIMPFRHAFGWLLMFIPIIGFSQVPATTNTAAPSSKENELQQQVDRYAKRQDTTKRNVPMCITKPTVGSRVPVVTSAEKTYTSEFSHDHTVWNTVLQNYVNPEGQVNYKDLKANRENLDRYLEQLQSQNPSETWSQAQKLAFWMNAYNAYTVDLILRNYPLQSIKDIKDPWKQEFIPIGGQKLSLEHIEHKILRPMGDPRIHFGINCASISCPALHNEAFTEANVDTQLETLAKDFINDPSRNKISEDKVQLSQIFQWFTKDFKQNGSLIDYIDKYAEISINPKAKKKYLDYNWNLNE